MNKCHEKVDISINFSKKMKLVMSSLKKNLKIFRIVQTANDTS